MFDILLSKLKNYIQIKRVKNNRYSAKCLLVASINVVSVAQQWLCHTCQPPRDGRIGTPVPLPHQLSKSSNYDSLPFLSLPFNIQRTHQNEQTNKPRALLMQQALYNEPKTACLLCKTVSVQTLRFSTSEPKLSFTAALGSAPAQIVPPRGKQKVHTGTPDIIWPVCLDSQVSVLYYSVDKGRDTLILQRIQETIRQFLLPPKKKIHFSRCFLKYLVGSSGRWSIVSPFFTSLGIQNSSQDNMILF